MNVASRFATILLGSALLVGPALFSSRALAAPAPAGISPAVGSGDLDGDGIDDGLEQMLAERFAPVIYLHPYETNYPVNVDWFLDHARLEYYEDCFPDVNEAVPGAPNPLGSQDALLGAPWAHPDDWGAGHPERHCGDAPEHRRITATEADPESYSDQTTFVLPDLPDAVKVGSLDPSDWKSYVHVYPNDEGGVTVQFWHTFAYNGYDYVGFGNHGGDWDATIHIVLGPDLEPLRAIYSRHSDDHPGKSFPWSEVHTYQGTHPLMIIDRGGHGAFKDPADHDADAPPGSDYTWREDPDGTGWGTVWKTWTGGEVRQDDIAPFPVTHHISPNPGVTGGIVNLGEYNPGVHQPTALLAGQFHPLNGQLFLAYEGRWGSPGLIFSGPRGPVFQGYDGGIYRSWYQGASGAPAAPATHPWKEPPATTLSLVGPEFDGPEGVRYVTDETSIFLGATENPVAASYGHLATYWRAYRYGETPPSFQRYDSPPRLTGPDGAYTFEFYTVDALGNVETVQTTGFILDTTGPAVEITRPAAESYPHSAMLTLDYGADDGTGSGVKSTEARMDGAASVAGHDLADGVTLDLLTGMTLGTHLFRVEAGDGLDNTAADSVQFRIVVTPESILEDVNRFLADDSIAGKLGTSLTQRLQQAASLVEQNGCGSAMGIYLGFVNQASAQAGKGIDPEAASILIGDARYLMNCSGPAVPPSGGNLPDPVFAAAAEPGSAGRAPGIHYSLPASGRVTIRIFDVAGRLVATALDGDESAGSHDLPLGDPLQGSKAGVYFYRLDWSGRALTGKLVLVE